jgi:hypothetical protein
LLLEYLPAHVWGFGRKLTRLWSRVLWRLLLECLPAHAGSGAVNPTQACVGA